MSEIQPAQEAANVTQSTNPTTGDEEWKKFLTPPKEAITPADLQTCCAIIQMSSKAGVFTPSDFKTVGALYEKLSEYVNHIRAKDIETALKGQQVSTTETATTGTTNEEKKDPEATTIKD